LKMGRRPRVILVVEDNPLVRLDAAQSLRDAGYDVHEAADSQQAISFLRSTSAVDLIFTDVNLGKGMNGVELALWALANTPRLKVLLTTGERLGPAIPTALGAILAKPYAVRELLRRVAHALGDLARPAVAPAAEARRGRGC